MRGKADGKGMWKERPGEIDEVNGDQWGGRYKGREIRRDVRRNGDSV